MSLKQFYLLSLFLISFFGTLIHLVIWYKSRRENKNNPGPLFIALAALTWATIGIVKFYDPTIPELANAIKDRVLSSFSNLFLVVALPYIASMSKFSMRLKLLKNKDNWFLSTFIFFTALSIFFTFMDRTVTNDLGRISIILIDSVISIISLGMVSIALFLTLRLQWKMTGMSLISGIILSALILTQAFLPMIAIYPAKFGQIYPFVLLTMLTSIAGFLFLSALQFVIETMSNNDSVTLNQKELKIDNISIINITVGYEEKEKLYFIELIFKNIDTDHTFGEKITFSKLMQPLVNWYVFALAREKDIKLSYPDIALNKFRMVELWNKQAQQLINQEQLFLNDNGHYEFNVESSEILIKNKSFFNSKFAVSSAINKQLTDKSIPIDAFLK
jgi:hypothetical protein